MIRVVGDYSNRDVSQAVVAVSTRLARSNRVCYYYSNASPAVDRSLSLPTQPLRSIRFGKSTSACVWLSYAPGLPFIAEHTPKMLHLLVAGSPEDFPLLRHVVGFPISIVALTTAATRTIATTYPELTVHYGGGGLVSLAKGSLPKTNRTVTVYYDNAARRQHEPAFVEFMERLIEEVPGIRLQVFSQGSRRRDLRRRWRQLTSRSTRFCEIRNPDTAQRRLAYLRSEWFIDLSPVSSVSYYAQEAVACRTPVIAWQTTAQLDSVGNQSCGILVPASSYQDILGNRQAVIGPQELKEFSAVCRNALLGKRSFVVEPDTWRKHVDSRYARSKQLWQSICGG